VSGAPSTARSAASGRHGNRAADVRRRLCPDGGDVGEIEEVLDDMRSIAMFVDTIASDGGINA
jgi:hypothetical protein